MGLIDLTEINLPYPLLKEKESIYLEELKEIYIVEKVIRTDRDNVLYIVKNAENKINDESMKKYEQDKAEYLKNIKKINEDSYVKNTLVNFKNRYKGIRYIKEVLSFVKTLKY